MKKAIIVLAAALLVVGIFAGARLVAAHGPTPETPDSSYGYGHCPMMGEVSPEEMMGPGMMGGWGMDYGLYDERTLERIATALKTTPEELWEELTSGTALAEIAAAKQVPADTLISIIIAPYQDTLAVYVKYGYLTQEEAELLVKQRTLSLERAIKARLAYTPTFPRRGQQGPSTIKPTPGTRNGGGMMGGGMMGEGMMGW